jgi:RNA polymerase sigma-54 factor
MTFVEPDAIIHTPPPGQDTPFSIELFSPVPGWLRVSERFTAALDACPASERRRLSECVEQAELLVRSLEQRSTTMQRLLAAIVREQGAYLLGHQHDPKPMTRAQLAHQLDLHESTISRAVANKTVALPNGRLISLEHFFQQSLTARRALKAIIAAEQRPMSDDELAQELKLMGLGVARRTVAKYREIERIPPANERGHRSVSEQQ